MVASVGAQEADAHFPIPCFEPEEHPISAQFFGSDVAVMADAARVCQDLGFDIVDINFGCPVNKVVKCNGGSGLLRDLPLVEQILRAVRAAISIPLTMKFRAGWNDQELVAVQMAQLAEDCGLQAVALHPRTREQGYSGQADWTRIAEVKQAVKNPGDRQRRHHHARRCRAHGAGDQLRRGDDRPRGFVESLDLPADRAVRRNGTYDQPDRTAALRHHADVLPDAARRAKPDAVGKMKQFATYFTHGVRNGSKLRAEIYRTTKPGRFWIL